MTEQEAEAMAARLTRIWKPKRFSFSVNKETGPHSSDFEYEATLSGGLTLEVAFGASWLDASESFEISRNKVSLLCEDGHLGSWKNDAPQESEEVLAAQWLPFFRRSCWLSGCPIEASAHEKAEWMQGFTREELIAFGVNEQWQEQ